MSNLTKSNSNTTDYKIYLVNEGTTSKNFWCFLKTPEGVLSDAVYANSNATLSVTPSYEGTNSFTIPLQYVIGAGADNEAVGLDVKIESMIVKDVALKDAWNTTYATTPPKQGPQMSLAQNVSAPDNTIQIISNAFDQKINEDNKWFSNMSFGINSANGFMGVTWSPSPSETSTLTPKFSFYIATGNYKSNSLVDMDTVSNNSAEIELSNFKNCEATVTLTSTGEWLVTPGAPGK